MWLTKVNYGFGQGDKLNRELSDYLIPRDRRILHSRGECEALASEVREVIESFCIRNRRAKRAVQFYAPGDHSDECSFGNPLDDDFFITARMNLIVEFVKIKSFLK